MKTVFVLQIVLAFLLTSCSSDGTKGDEGRWADSIPLLVTRVRNCSRLYGAECKVHKIVTHEDRMRLKGTLLQKSFNIPLPMTGRKVAIPINATLKAYVDLGDFTTENVVRRGEKIEIVLPDPKVELTESRIDHEGIVRYVQLMRSNFTDAQLSEYENEGRAVILNSVLSFGIIEVARENVAHTLLPLLRQMGYIEEDITITFRKNFTEDDIPLLLDSKTIGYER